MGTLCRRCTRRLGNVIGDFGEGCVNDAGETGGICCRGCEGHCW